MRHCSDRPERICSCFAFEASLPRPVRRAFLWSQLEGLGYREIAERLQVSERTVKRYMAQAYEHCLLADL